MGKKHDIKCSCGKPKRIDGAHYIGIQETNREYNLALFNCPSCKTTFVLKIKKEKK